MSRKAEIANLANENPKRFIYQSKIHQSVEIHQNRVVMSKRMGNRAKWIHIMSWHIEPNEGIYRVLEWECEWDEKRESFGHFQYFFFYDGGVWRVKRNFWFANLMRELNFELNYFQTDLYLPRSICNDRTFLFVQHIFFFIFGAKRGKRKNKSGWKVWVCLCARNATPSEKYLTSSKWNFVPQANNQSTRPVFTADIYKIRRLNINERKCKSNLAHSFIAKICCAVAKRINAIRQSFDLHFDF